MQRLAGGLLVLAAIPPAYAGFVYGWQLVGFGEMATRLDDALPAGVWLQIVMLVLPFVAIASALFVAWESVSKTRMRRSLIALAVAWIASLPLYLMFVQY